MGYGAAWIGPVARLEMNPSTSTKSKRPAERRTEQVSPSNDARSRADALEAALCELQDRYPSGPMLAAGSSGQIVELPESVPRKENPVLRGRSGFNAVPAEDHEALIQAFDQVLAEGTAQCVLHPPFYDEVTWYGFDLRERHGVVVVLLGADGDPSAALDEVGTRDMMQLGPPRFATIRKDETAFIIGLTDTTSEILGWSAEDMVGQRSLEFIHPDDQPLAIENWIESMAQPGPARRIRQRLRHKDGSWVWFEVTNHNLFHDPDHGCVVAEMVDISDEMAAQEALRAREEVLARLAETIPLGLLQTDADGRVTYTNDRLHEILGVGRLATIWEQFSTVVEADRQALKAALDGVLNKGSDADAEVELRVPPSGELRFCTINIRALRREGGTISGAIACVIDVTDSVHLREELKKRATFDRLTGCYNRESIILALETNIASGGPDADRAVMFIDLDRFKEVNDRNGHAVGDELLSTVAERLRGVLRQDDLIGRIGGDEFLVLCPDVGGPHQAMRLAERLSQAIRRDGSRTTGDIDPLASIGVGWSKGTRCDADALVAQADGAMYESKDEGLGAPRLADAATPEQDGSSTRP
jgi:diguanylate cyclase (GGDEF)-like protein/PAS domain S-box-containing protein